MYILWNNYMCTEKQHITLLVYKSTICTSSVYHVWRQISTWNNIIMAYWLQRVPQSSISNLVRQGSTLHPPKQHHLLHTDSSTKGLRAHTDNLKVSVLWTPSQAQNHSKTTTASDSPSSGPLEFWSNGSEIVHSGWIKQLHSSGVQTEWWHGVQKYLSTDQNVIDVSPGIQQHSPYEVHSRIYECHHGYSVKEEQVSPNIMVILP